MNFKFLIERTFIITTILFATGGPIPLLRQQNYLYSDAGDTTMQYIWLLIYLFSIAILIIKRNNYLEIVINNRLLIILIAFALLSTLWSNAPALTFRRSSALIGTTIFAIYISTKYNFNDILGFLFTALIIGSILSVVFVIFLPHKGIMVWPHEGAWRGIYTHKNTFGYTMCLGSITSLILLFSRKKKRYLISFLFSIVLLYKSNSTTSIFTLFLSLIIFFSIIFFKRRNIYLLLSFIPFILLLFFYLSLDIAESINILLNLFGKDSSLSGRRYIWYFLSSIIQKNILLGTGYCAFWTSSNNMIAYLQMGKWVPGSAHNGLLELIIDLGFIGFFIFCIVFFRALVTSINFYLKPKTTENLWPFIFLLVYFTISLSESVILVRNNIFWMLFVIVYSFLANSTPHLNAKDPLKNLKENILNYYKIV